ncbi:phospholipase A [Xanthomonas populi]
MSRVGDFFRADGEDQPNAGRGSLLDHRWELSNDFKLGTFRLRGLQADLSVAGVLEQRLQPHPRSPNPANSVSTPQQLDSAGLKFQLSFKTKVVEDLFGDNGDLWRCGMRGCSA